MGYSISWLACRGLTAQAAYQRLTLNETTRTAEYARAELTAHGLPYGWHLIVADRCDHTMIHAPSLAELSVGCEVVACSIEEHVMVCSAELWREGTRRWRAEHSSEKGGSICKPKANSRTVWRRGWRVPEQRKPPNPRAVLESGGTGAADPHRIQKSSIRQGAGSAATRACHPASPHWPG